jgi:hypothetical protein
MQRCPQVIMRWIALWLTIDNAKAMSAKSHGRGNWKESLRPHHWMTTATTLRRWKWSLRVHCCACWHRSRQTLAPSQTRRRRERRDVLFSWVTPSVSLTYHTLSYTQFATQQETFYLNNFCILQGKKLSIYATVIFST